MVLNLKKMREENISQKLFEEKQSEKRHHFMDQDAFNEVFYKYVKFLSPTFNFFDSYPNMFNLMAMSEFFDLTLNETQRIMIEPHILHLTDKPKIWESRLIMKYGLYKELGNICLNSNTSVKS